MVVLLFVFLTWVVVIGLLVSTLCSRVVRVMLRVWLVLSVLIMVESVMQLWDLLRKVLRLRKWLGLSSCSSVKRLSWFSRLGAVASSSMFGACWVSVLISMHLGSLDLGDYVRRRVLLIMSRL